MCHVEGSDVALVRAIVGGDASAVGLLYDRYAPILLALARRIVRGTEAEDVVHDVLLVVWERASTYAAERGTVVAWLVTLTRNASLDRVRKRTRREFLVTREAETFAPAPAPDPEVATAMTEGAEVLRTAVQALPEEQRTVVFASFFEGLSYGEIAAREGVPLGTIKSRAARAFQSLGVALTAAGGDF